MRDLLGAKPGSYLLMAACGEGGWQCLETWEYEPDRVAREEAVRRYEGFSRYVFIRCTAVFEPLGMEG